VFNTSSRKRHGIALILLGELNDEFGDRHCQLVFPVDKLQCNQRVLKRVDKYLHLFGREGVIVLKKEANRHGKLPLQARNA